MPPPKRKSPDRKKAAARQPGLFTALSLALVRAAGRSAARHPKLLLGSSALVVTSSFIAANALWYQPGGHPHPFLATRDTKDPTAIAGYRPSQRPSPSDVTTFRIERAAPEAARPRQASRVEASAPQDAGAAAPVAPLVTPRPATPEPAKAEPVRPSAAAPSATSAAPSAARTPVRPAGAPPAVNVGVRAEDPVAAAIRAAERGPGKAMTPPAEIPAAGSIASSRYGVPVPGRREAERPAAAAELVLQIQRGLSNIAYADVEVDGVAGAQTKAAIRRFERHYRLPETGEPNEMVLRKLKSIGAL